MFCYQCEETAKGTGCDTAGVCGKDPYHCGSAGPPGLRRQGHLDVCPPRRRARARDRRDRRIRHRGPVHHRDQRRFRSRSPSRLAARAPRDPRSSPDALRGGLPQGRPIAREPLRTGCLAARRRSARSGRSRAQEVGVDARRATAGRRRGRAAGTDRSTASRAPRPTPTMPTCSARTIPRSTPPSMPHSISSRATTPRSTSCSVGR